MEVAAALLDASRKISDMNISNSDISTNSGTSRNSSANELNDKTGNLRSSNSWFGSWSKRARSMSESCSSPDKLDTMVWLGGWQIQNKNQTQTNTPHLNSGFLCPERPRIRRASTKDVEEAMAGGLSKADMYLSPV